jgi:2-iminobutanoate/2-iminopropanoate deaminase
MGIIPLDPPRAVASPLHSQGTLASAPGGLVFVSGQVGVSPDGTTAPGVAHQTRVTFDNVLRVLAEVDLTVFDISSLRIYLTSHQDIEAFTQSAKSCLKGHRPAATLLVLEHLADPSLLVQVEAVAVQEARA